MSDYAKLNYDVWNEIFPIRTHRSTTIASPPNSGVLYNLVPTFDTSDSRKKINLDLSKIIRYIEEEDRASLNSSQCHEVQLAGSTWRISLDDRPGESVQPTHIKNAVANMCTRRSLPPVPTESVYDSIKINKRQCGSPLRAWTMRERCWRTCSTSCWGLWVGYRAKASL